MYFKFFIESAFFSSVDNSSMCAYADCEPAVFTLLIENKIVKRLFFRTFRCAVSQAISQPKKISKNVRNLNKKQKTSLCEPFASHALFPSAKPSARTSTVRVCDVSPPRLWRHNRCAAPSCELRSSWCAQQQRDRVIHCFASTDPDMASAALNLMGLRAGGETSLPRFVYGTVSSPTPQIVGASILLVAFRVIKSCAFLAVAAFFRVVLSTDLAT